MIISALNTPPSDISLSNHTLAENLPAGSMVGVFSTTDPDDTNGTGASAYSLVSGTGDTDTTSLDLNGTLSILSTSDYEQRLIDSTTTALIHDELNAEVFWRRIILLIYTLLHRINIQPGPYGCVLWTMSTPVTRRSS